MFSVSFTPLSFPLQYGFQFEMTFICEGVFLNVCLPPMPKSCLFAHFFYLEPNSGPGIYSDGNQMDRKKSREYGLEGGLRNIRI